MVPPKYNFYIGRLLEIAFKQGEYTDLSTGEVVQDNRYYTTDKVDMANYSHIYINCSRPAGSHASVVFFDSNKTFISSLAFNIMPRIATCPKGTAYVAFNYSGSNPEFVNNFKNNKQFIYGLTTCIPHYKSLAKQLTKESNQEFFRTSLSGKITLFGDDYEFIKASSLEDELLFAISKTETAAEPYYVGTFNVTDCKFDYDRKSCELNQTGLDSYSKILNNYENTYDLIKITPGITRILANKRPVTQVYILGGSTISNYLGGTYWENDVDTAVDSKEEIESKFHFKYNMACNEFTVKDAKIPEANGVYAGSNGLWTNQNGCRCIWAISKDESTGVWSTNHLQIFRISDNVELYRSQMPYTMAPDEDYIIFEVTEGISNVRLVNRLGDDTDKPIIEDMFAYRVYKRILCDVSSITDAEGAKETYDMPIDDFTGNMQNYKKCIGLVNGYVFCSSQISDEPTRFGMNDYGKYFTNKLLPQTAYRPLPVCRSSWVNASLWSAYDSYYDTLDKSASVQYVIKDTYSIANVIKALLAKIDPSISHEATAEYSKFLYSETFPLFDLFNRFYVYITPKSNILKGDYDQPAQKAETTLKTIMEMLSSCFKCYWYIEDNKFKIEHISFFMNNRSYEPLTTVPLDLTTFVDQFNKKNPQYFQSAIEYDKSELNSRYEFSWADDATELFSGPYIDVLSKYVQADKKEDISVNDFSSDVDLMLLSPSSFSEDGFALLCPVCRYTIIAGSKTEKAFVRSNGDVVAHSSMYYITFGAASILRKYIISGVVYAKAKQNFYSIIAKDASGTVVYTYRPDIFNNNTTFPYTQPDITITLPSTATTLIVNSGNAGNVKVQALSGSLELPIVTEQLTDVDGLSYKATAQNFYASWKYLLQFYMYDMPSTKIDVSEGMVYSVKDIKRFIKHTLSLPLATDLNSDESLKTNLGVGIVNEFSVDIDTRFAKLNLLYKP